MNIRTLNRTINCSADTMNRVVTAAASTGAGLAKTGLIKGAKLSLAAGQSVALTLNSVLTIAKVVAQRPGHADDTVPASPDAPSAATTSETAPETAPEVAPETAPEAVTEAEPEEPAEAVTEAEAPAEASAAEAHE